jgi:hypothetical protein
MFSEQLNLINLYTLEKQYDFRYGSASSAAGSAIGYAFVCSQAEFLQTKEFLETPSEIGSKSAMQLAKENHEKIIFEFEKSINDLPSDEEIDYEKVADIFPDGTIARIGGRREYPDGMIELVGGSSRRYNKVIENPPRQHDEVDLFKFSDDEDDEANKDDELTMIKKTKWPKFAVDLEGEYMLGFNKIRAEKIALRKEREAKKKESVSKKAKNAEIIAEREAKRLIKLAIREAKKK